MFNEVVDTLPEIGPGPSLGLSSGASNLLDLRADRVPALELFV